MGGLKQQVLTRGSWQPMDFSLAGSAARLRATPGVEPGDNSVKNGSEQRHAQLLRTIEGEIIPRLMLAHSAAHIAASCPAAVPTGTTPANPANVDPDAGPSFNLDSSNLDSFDLDKNLAEVIAGQPEKTLNAEAVTEFSKLILTHDSDVVAAHIEALRADGVTLESLFLDLLMPAARRLGEWWEEDLCDFTEVTVGLWRLQQVMRDLSPAFQNDAENRVQNRRALLVSAPGEQHTFGFLMVTEFFLRAGWDVWGGPPTSSDDLLAMVHSDWFDLAGLSVSCESRLDAVAADIRAIRRESHNPKIYVMVGGRVFNDHPEYVTQVGADATAADGRQAPAVAEGLLAAAAESR